MPENVLLLYMADDSIKTTKPPWPARSARMWPARSARMWPTRSARTWPARSAKQHLLKTTFAQNNICSKQHFLETTFAQKKHLFKKGKKEARKSQTFAAVALLVLVYTF